MITKKTRVLSFLTTALMLVSMLACFVIPASAAETKSALEILKDNYTVLRGDVTDNTESTEDAYDVLSAAIAAVEEAIAGGATEDTDGTLQTALDTAVAQVASESALKEDIKPRAALNAIYAAAGYAGLDYSITTVEDWTVGVAAKRLGFCDFYVTNDIDFENVAMAPIGVFNGYIHGNNKSFLNVNITVSNTGSNDNGGALISRTYFDTANALAADKVCGIENLTLTGNISYTCSGSSAGFAGSFVANVQNGSFEMNNCKSSVNLSVTTTGSYSPKIGGLVGKTNIGSIVNSEYSGTLTVKNANTTNPYVGGIVGYIEANTVAISDCAFGGTLNYTTTVNSVDDFIGGIVGYNACTAANKGLIANCAFTGYINDTSAVATAGITNKGATAGIVGYMGNANNIVNNCYSIGTIVSTGGSATSLGYLHNAGKYYNSIGAGVMISGGGLKANTALKSHSNIGASDAASVYAVNMNLAFFKADSSIQAATATANSAAEAAYLLNKNYNTAGGTQTYFTMKDGKIAFGTEADQIVKVTVNRGALAQDFYFAKGSTVKLADIYAEKATSVSVGDTFVAEDGLVINVTDSAESAKAVLAAAEDLGWESVDLPMFTETAAWLEAAATLAEGNDVAAILAKAAELKGIVAGTLTIKADAVRPRAKKDAYKTLGNETKDKWAVSTAEDWLALIDAKDQFGGKDIVVYKDIDFKNRPMKPIQDGNAFNGNLLGNGHVFKNINITNTVASAGLNHGGGLISRANGTATQVISNLGLTGTINYTVTGIEASRAARFGALVGNNTATITNCWADVDANVTIAGDYTAEIGGLVAYTGNAPITNCSFDGTLNVTVATKSEGTYIGGVVGSAVGGAVTNCTADGEITVNAKNCAHKFWAGGVVGSSNKDVVGCVNRATLKVYGWSGDEYIGGVIGRGHANVVYKCVNEGDLWSDTQTNGNNGIGGIIGSAGSAGVVDACLNIGTVKVDSGVAKGISGAFNGVSTKVFNTLDVGTVVAPAGTGAIMYHNPGYMYDGTNLIVYNVVSLDNIFIGRGENTGNPDAEITAADGSKHKNTTAAWNAAEAYKADSAAEAAWKVNTYYNSTYSSGKGQVVFTIEDGKVAFGTADNQVRRIAITRGSSATYAYAVAGEEVDLFAINPGLAKADTLVVDNEIGDVTETGKFTMVNNDVTVTVTDTLESAKSALIEKIDEAWDAEDLNMYTETQAWLANAKDLVANGESASDVIDAVIAIDGILAGELTLKEDAYAPYSKIAEYVAKGWVDAKKYSINSKEDWLALVAKGAVSGIEIHVNRDIDFGGEPMLPQGRRQNAGFDACIFDGHGYTFKNINVVDSFSAAELETRNTHQRYGVALFAAAKGGSVIKNLGVTGKVTNNTPGTQFADGNPVLTAALVAGKHNGTGAAEGYGTYGFVIDNCWTNVHVKGPSTTTTYGLGAINAYAQADNLIQNCINYGTVESTTNGNAGAFTHATLKNCINAGSFVTTGNAASFMVENVIVLNNCYSVGASYVCNYKTAAIDNTNQVSAKEAAYKATNGTTYYTVKDGELAFGTATDRVFKVKLIGDYEAVGYYLPGETVDLYALGLPEYDDTKLNDGQIEPTFTMGTEDITITVAYGDSQIGTIQPELNNWIDLFDDASADLLTDASYSSISTWLTQARAAATYAEMSLAVAAAEALTVDVADDKYPAYSQFALYGKDASHKKWSIGIAKDWIDLTVAYEGKSCDLNLIVTDDIYFEQAMIPLNKGGVFTGTLDGQWHEFHDISITGTLSSTDSQGIALVAKVQNGSIYRLGIASGSIVSTANGTTQGYTGAFTARFVSGTIQNCWNYADITAGYTHSNRGNYVGICGAVDAGALIDGCLNYGTIRSLNGVVAAFAPYPNAGMAINSINAGQLISSNTSPSGSFINHGNTFSSDRKDAYPINTFDVYNDLIVLSGTEETGATVTLPNGKVISKANFNDFAAVSTEAEAGYRANTELANWTIANFTAKTGFATTYYTLNENGKLAISQNGGLDQIRKVTFKQDGQADIVTYVNQGDTLDVTQFGGFTDLVTYTEATDGAIGASYKVPNRDIEITISSSVPAGYPAARATLEARLETYNAYLGSKYAATIITNKAEIESAVSAINTLFGQIEGATTAAPFNEAITLAATEEIKPNLGENKIPYAEKAIFAAIDTANAYGIYDEADWNAFATGGAHSGETFYLMNNITLTAAETAPITSFAGTLNGQGNTISGIKITKLTNKKATLIHTLTGTVSNLTLEGEINVSYGSAEDTSTEIAANIAAFVGTNSGTVTGCTNNVNITVDGYGYAKDTAIGGIVAWNVSTDKTVTNCTNNGKLDITLTGSTSLVWTYIGGIVGRARANDFTNNVNTGDIEVTIRDNTSYYGIGGIAADIAGTAKFYNCRNEGNITVNNGGYAYVGGIAGVRDEAVTTVAGSTNIGSITYNGDIDDGIKVIDIAGIANAPLAANTAETANTNSGNITVRAPMAVQLSVFGIANSADDAENFFATNTGTIWVGGVDADATHVAGDTISGAESTKTTICNHANSTYVHNDGTYTHTQTCNEANCGYVKTKDCKITWVKNEAVVEGDTVTATSTGKCADCLEEDEFVHNCTGAWNTHDEDCMMDDEYIFDCACGREKLVVDNGHADHTYDDSKWVADPENAGYEMNTCTCEGCGGVTYRVNETAMGNANGDATVDLIDAILTLREAAGLNGENYDEDGNTLSGEPGAEGTKIVFYFAFGDIDGDKKITSDDATLIVRKWLKNV